MDGHPRVILAIANHRKGKNWGLGSNGTKNRDKVYLSIETI